MSIKIIQCVGYLPIFSNRKTKKEKFIKLLQLQKNLEKQSLEIEWNTTKNPAARGTIRHRPPSEYLEEIADILFQFDIVFACNFQYFDAIELKETKSYENLMNSFGISQEVVDFVREFLIKNVMLFS